MIRKSLITISFWILLLSSFSAYAEESDTNDSSCEYTVGNWIPYNIEGQPTNRFSQTTMWKLVGEKVWVSSVRERSVYNKSERYVKWNEANDVCETAEYSGFDNWRLPTIEELKHFADKGIANIKNIQGIEDLSSYFIWSSTKVEGKNERYVLAGIELGGIDSEPEELSTGLFFCVRTEN